MHLLNMKIKYLLYFILTLLMYSTKSIAQQYLPVEEAIAAALKNNYDILLLKNDSTVFAIDNQYASAALLPKLNATNNLLFNTNYQKQKLVDGSIKNGTGIQSFNVNAAVNLNWTLFNGYKLKATREKQAEYVKLGDLNIKNQLIITAATVIRTYYNIVKQKQQLKAIEEQMLVNEERVKISNKRVSVGLAAKPELLQAKIDLNAQKSARLTQLHLIEQLKEELNLVASFTPGATYEVSDTIPINLNLNISDVFSGADKDNPVLKTNKENIKIANLTLKEKKADRYPLLSFNSTLNFGKTKNEMVVNTFTPLLNQNLGYNYGTTLSIPIFNGFNAKKEIKKAMVDVEYNQLLYNYAYAKIQHAITIAFKDYESQKKLLQFEQENILLAKENLLISIERLRLGVTTILELRETQKSLQEAFTRLINARYNTKVAETELLQLQGGLIN